MKLFVTLLVFQVLTTIGDFLYSQSNFWDYPIGPMGGDIYNISSTSNGQIYSVVNGRVFMLVETVNKWRSIGLPPLLFPQSVYKTTSGLLFVSCGNKIIRSNNDGENWETVLDTDWVGPIREGIDNDLFAGAKGGVYKSTDNGATWLYLSGLPAGIYVTSLFFNSNGYLFAGSNMWQTGWAASLKVYRTIDGGLSWQNLTPPFWTSGSSVSATSFINDSSGGILASIFRGGIIRTTDNGNSWYHYHLPYPDADYSINSMVTNSQGEILSSIYQNFGNNNIWGIYKSTNNGQSDPTPI